MVGLLECSSIALLPTIALSRRPFNLCGRVWRRWPRGPHLSSRAGVLPAVAPTKGTAAVRKSKHQSPHKRLTWHRMFWKRNCVFCYNCRTARKLCLGEYNTVAQHARYRKRHERSILTLRGRQARMLGKTEIRENHEKP